MAVGLSGDQIRLLRGDAPFVAITLRVMKERNGQLPALRIDLFFTPAPPVPTVLWGRHPLNNPVQPPY